MSIHSVLVEEAQTRIGTERLFVNALHGVREVHEGEGVAAYEDGDRHVRISAYGLLRSPRRVFRELMQLSRGRWTAADATSAVRRAYHHVRARLARRAR